MQKLIMIAILFSVNSFAQWSTINNQLRDNPGFHLTNSKKRSYIDQNWNVNNGEVSADENALGIISKVYNNGNQIEGYKSGEINIEVKWQNYLTPDGQLNKKRKIMQVVQNVGDDFHLVLDLDDKQNVTQAIRCQKDMDSDLDGVNDVKNCVVANEEVCLAFNNSLKSGRLKTSLASINSCKSVLSDMSEVLRDPQHMEDLSTTYANHSDKIDGETEGFLIHSQIDNTKNQKTLSHLENMSRIIALCNENDMGKKSFFSKRSSSSVKAVKGSVDTEIVPE